MAASQIWIPSSDLQWYLVLFLFGELMVAIKQTKPNVILHKEKRLYHFNDLF